MSWLVLLDRWQPVDPRPLASEVAGALRLSPLEARMHLKRSGGIVVQDVPERVARKVQQLLQDQGVPSHVLDLEARPPLPAPVRASALTLFEDMLQIQLDTKLLCAWDAFSAVCAGIIREEGYVQAIIPPDIAADLTPEEADLVRENTILQVNRAPDPAAAVPPAKRKTVLDLIETDSLPRSQPVLDLLLNEDTQWIRLSSESLVYDRGKLKVGGGLGYSILMKDLIRECPAGALSPITLNCFAGHDIRDVSFASLAEVTRYTSWFALRKTISP